MRPLPHELLGMVAAALTDTVLPALTDGPARRQLKAAISIIARSAAAIPLMDQYLREDIDDVASTLDGLGADVGRTRLPGVARGPTVPDLIVEHDAVHAELESFCEAVDAAMGGDLAALLVRVLDRELALGLSPWRLS
ncbi:MAG: hypothetical protein JWN62_4634 [Acidimicrobiales bacterium]|nr:hypothetical protein [Acidimicrobiales bacterium]